MAERRELNLNREQAQEFVPRVHTQSELLKTWMRRKYPDGFGGLEIKYGFSLGVEATLRLLLGEGSEKNIFILVNNENYPGGLARVLDVVGIKATPDQVRQITPVELRHLLEKPNHLKEVK
ncbi:MAG: hypothetical protein AAB414_04145 [Patescibacteria group bacterium]